MRCLALGFGIVLACAESFPSMGVEPKKSAFEQRRKHSCQDSAKLFKMKGKQTDIVSGCPVCGKNAQGQS